jgi:hypothetical protein
MRKASDFLIKVLNPDGFDEMLVVVWIVKVAYRYTALSSRSSMDKLVVADIDTYMSKGAPRIEENKVTLF